MKKTDLLKNLKLLDKSANELQRALQDVEKNAKAAGDLAKKVSAASKIKKEEDFTAAQSRKLDGEVNALSTQLSQLEKVTTSAGKAKLGMLTMKKYVDG